VHNPSNMPFNLACIYSDPHHQQTSSIWKNVLNFMLDSPDRATFCMGDLNNVMRPSEKCGHKPASISRMRELFALIKQCGLIDMGYSGPATHGRINTLLLILLLNVSTDSWLMQNGA
jgi:hypothetical protein